MAAHFSILTLATFITFLLFGQAGQAGQAQQKPGYASQAYDVEAVVKDLKYWDRFDLSEVSELKEKNRVKKLIAIIEKYVAPLNWQKNGGTGRIKYAPVDKRLVVYNSAPEIHEDIDALLLKAIRRLADLTVVLDVRSAILCERDWNRLKKEMDSKGPEKSGDGWRALSARQKAELLKRAKASSNPQIAEVRRYHVLNGQSAQIPLSFPDGLGHGNIEVAITPLVSGDRLSVRLACQNWPLFGKSTEAEDSPPDFVNHRPPERPSISIADQHTGLFSWGSWQEGGQTIHGVILVTARIRIRNKE